MITQALLKRIQEKNPKFTIVQINDIIRHHISAINFKLCSCQTIKMKVPKLGTIHTHGNVKSINRINLNKAQARRFRIRVQYTDAQLLF